MLVGAVDAVGAVEEGQTKRNDYRISHHHRAAVLFLASVQWTGGNLTRVSSTARYGCAAMPVGSFLWVISTVDQRGSEATVHRGRG